MRAKSVKAMVFRTRSVVRSARIYVFIIGEVSRLKVYRLSRREECSSNVFSPRMLAFLLIYRRGIYDTKKH
jgi:hypothetical protein